MTKLHFASTLDPDMLYLLQYQVSDPVIYLERAGVKRVFLNGLEREAFQQFGNQKLEVVSIEDYRVPGNQAATVSAILEKFGVEGPVLVPPQFPVSMADWLRKHSYELVVDEDWGSNRASKSESEIEALASNQQITVGAFKLIEQILADAHIQADTLVYDDEILTSKFLKREINQYFLQHDYSSPAGLIVSCGKDAAAPHHVGAGPLRPHQTIVVDLFPQSQKNHYFADMTRTYVKGVPSERVNAMYEAVYEARRASLAALTPGLTAAALYQVSADVITAAGFDVGEKGYIHSLGHGLGVALHEAPTLGPNSHSELKPGMVITIEPGLYYPQYGGVRLEDTVVVTETGYRNLTEHDNNWVIE